MEKRVLCSASRYTQKYYLNEEFRGLPTLVKDELKIMCVLFTEEVGGVIILLFDEEGNLKIVTQANEDDASFDEIGCHLKVKQLQVEKKEFFTQLEEYYDAFF